jgi:hypothetical protein
MGRLLIDTFDYSRHPEDGGDTFLRNVGSQDLHGATSRKMAFFIITAVKTSNPNNLKR